MPCLYGLFSRKTSQGWIVAELRAIALLYPAPLGRSPSDCLPLSTQGGRL